MASTAATIINNVAVEVGLNSSANPYTSADQNFILLRTLLNSAGTELLKAFDWTQFTAEASITGDALVTSYAVPSDFDHYIASTGWNRTQQVPFSAPLTPQEWQELKSDEATAQVLVFWRLQAGRIEFLNPPADDDDIKYEYISTYWASTSNGVGIGTKASCTLATDYVLLNETCITRLLKMKWLQAKGLDFTAAAGEYARAYQAAVSSEPARILYLPGTGGILGNWYVPLYGG